MIRVHRRASRSPAVPRDAVVAWSRTGYLQPNDHLADPAAGTLFVSETEWLAAAQRDATRRRARDTALAAAAFLLAALLARGGGLVGGLAAVALMACAAAALTAAQTGPLHDVADLPDPERAAAHERRRQARHLADSLLKAAGLCAAAGLFLGLGTPVSGVLGAAGMVALAARGLLRRR